MSQLHAAYLQLVYPCSIKLSVHFSLPWHITHMIPGLSNFFCTVRNQKLGGGLGMRLRDTYMVIFRITMVSNVRCTSAVWNRWAGLLDWNTGMECWILEWNTGMA